MGARVERNIDFTARISTNQDCTHLNLGNKTEDLYRYM